MGGLLATFLVTAVSLLILSRLNLGLEIEDLGTAFVAALVLGLLNATLRPVLGFLTFPIVWLTFGIFSVVLNGLVLYIAAALVKGFRLRGCLSAIVISILLGVLNGLIFWILPGT
jgi:putative membrane protein